jgi:hypothetical protein
MDDHSHLRKEKEEGENAFADNLKTQEGDEGKALLDRMKHISHLISKVTNSPQQHRLSFIKY